MQIAQNQTNENESLSVVIIFVVREGADAAHVFEANFIHATRCVCKDIIKFRSPHQRSDSSSLTDVSDLTAS